MVTVDQKTRLLVVDISPAYAEALRSHLQSASFATDVHADPQQALQHLCAPRTECGAVVLGWPLGNTDIVNDLLRELNKGHLADLPLLIVTHGANREAQMLAKIRTATTLVDWKSYQQLGMKMEALLSERNFKPAMSSQAVKEIGVDQSTEASNNQYQSATAINPIVPAIERRVLLVDNAPSVGITLRKSLEAKGYQVVLAENTWSAKLALQRNIYDLVVAEFFHLGESREDLCRYMQQMASGHRPVYALMTRQNLSQVVHRSLNVGAAVCLDKNVPTDALAGRIEDLINTLPVRDAGRAIASLASQAVPVVQIPGTVKAATATKTPASATDDLQPVATVRAPTTIAETAPPSISGASQDFVKKKPVKIMDTRIFKTVLNGALASGTGFGLLMLDVKMKAVVTGDSMGLDCSRTMLKLVKSNLLQACGTSNPLSYMGEGRFAVLIKASSTGPALELGKRLVENLPASVKYLKDVELVSHAAFLALPEDQTIDAAHALRHCKVACIKGAISCGENSVYVIDTELQQRRSVGKAGAVRAATPEVSVSESLQLDTPELYSAKQRAAAVN